jgi:hypothetical protein
MSITWLICAALWLGITWACSIVPLAVNIFIALSNEAYSAKI